MPNAVSMTPARASSCKKPDWQLSCSWHMLVPIYLGQGWKKGATAGITALPAIEAVPPSYA